MAHVRRDRLQVVVYAVTLCVVLLLSHRVNAAGANGTSCTSAADCNSGICDATNKVCCGDGESDCTNGTDCTVSDDCISEVCDDTTNTCCGDGKGDCTEGSRCFSNEDCQSGQCPDGRCVGGPIMPSRPAAKPTPALSRSLLLALAALLGTAGWLHVRRRSA